MTDEEVVGYLRDVSKEGKYDIFTLDGKMTSNSLPYNEAGKDAPIRHIVKHCFKGSRDRLEEEVEEGDLFEWVSHAAQITVPILHRIDEGIKHIHLFQKNWDGSWSLTSR